MANPTDAPAADSERDALDLRVKALEAELAESKNAAADLTDRLKRLGADFDNFRKRAKRDVDEAANFGREDLLKELLVVADNFDRAFVVEGSDEALYHGVKLIYKQFNDLLGKNGLERIDAVGHPFDPVLHEAVMREVTDAYPDGAIIQEFERGYRYRGRVLRAAKVKVASAPPSAPPADDATKADGPA